MQCLNCQYRRSVHNCLFATIDIGLSLDNRTAWGYMMSRAKHQSKDIESALQELEALGWGVEEAKGRSTHSWGMSCVRPMREMHVDLECFAGCRFGARPGTRATMHVS